MTFLSEQKARKEYNCCVCREPIKIGDVYVREASPAWDDVDGDVDDEGRPIAVQKPHSERQWTVNQIHSRCFDFH